MESTTITRDELDKLLRLKARAVRLDIDAATCGGRYWDLANEADDILHDAVEALFKDDD